MKHTFVRNCIFGWPPISLYLGKKLIFRILLTSLRVNEISFFYVNIKLSSRYLQISFARWSFGLVLNGVIALCWMVGVLRHSGPLFTNTVYFPSWVLVHTSLWFVQKALQNSCYVTLYFVCVKNIFCGIKNNLLYVVVHDIYNTQKHVQKMSMINRQL